MANNKKNNKKPTKRDDLVKPKAAKKKPAKKKAPKAVDVVVEPVVEPVRATQPELDLPFSPVDEVKAVELVVAEQPAFVSSFVREEETPIVPPFQKLVNWAKLQLFRLTNW